MKYNRQFARRQWKNSFPGQNSAEWRGMRQKGRSQSYRTFLGRQAVESAGLPVVAAE